MLVSADVKKSICNLNNNTFNIDTVRFCQSRIKCYKPKTYLIHHGHTLPLNQNGTAQSNFNANVFFFYLLGFLIRIFTFLFRLSRRTSVLLSLLQDKEKPLNSFRVLFACVTYCLSAEHVED